MKVVLLSGQFAPFQLEVADAVNAAGVSYRVIFDQHENRRPQHWLRCDPALMKHCVKADRNPTPTWYDAQLEREAPDILLVGGVRGPRPAAAFRYRRRNPKTRVGLWLEPPNPQPNRLLRFLRAADYSVRLPRADFVCAIGVRTAEYWSRWQERTFLVPYGEDLSLCMAAPLPRPRGGPLRFLFSGGLERRHNFPQILEAFERLLEMRGPCFEFVISGSGKMQALLDETLARKPALAALVRYDRDFIVWTDRIRPFTEADVFVYPTDYAGWGLVIPEAMAAGAVVITATGAEAAHYFIENGRNGLIVGTSADEIFAAFLKCVDEADWLSGASRLARESARRGDAPYVAGLLLDAIAVVNGQRL